MRVLLLVFAAVGLWFGYRLYYMLTTVIPDAYCVWNVADLVITYMENHQGQWPQSWDDLRKTYDIHEKRAWSFEELKERVSVDFHADPKKLSETVPTEGTPPFRVIWTNSGSGAYWSLREPNRLILDYLKEHQENSDEPKPNRANRESRA